MLNQSIFNLKSINLNIITDYRHFMYYNYIKCTEPHHMRKFVFTYTVKWLNLD